MVGLGLWHSPGPCVPFWSHCPWPWDLGRPTALGPTPKCQPLHSAGRHSPSPWIPFWGQCPWLWDLGWPTALGPTPKCQPLYPAGRQGVKCASVAHLPPHIQQLEGCFLFLDLLNKFMPGCLQRDAASYTECAGPNSQGIWGGGGVGRLLHLVLHCHQQNDSASRWVVVWAILIVQ